MPQWSGPWTITEIKGVKCKLDCPADRYRGNYVHVNKLKHFPTPRPDTLRKDFALPKSYNQWKHKKSKIGKIIVPKSHKNLKYYPKTAPTAPQKGPRKSKEQAQKRKKERKNQEQPIIQIDTPTPVVTITTEPPPPPRSENENERGHYHENATFSENQENDPEEHSVVKKRKIDHTKEKETTIRPTPTYRSPPPKWPLRSHTRRPQPPLPRVNRLGNHQGPATKR